MGETEGSPPSAAGARRALPSTPAEIGVLATRDAAGVLRPFPLLSHDFDLSTAIREVKGLLEFHVTISNRDRRAMEHLVVTPALADELRLADEESKRVAQVPPGESATLKFKLTVSEDARSAGIGGRPLAGLDFEVQTSLRVRKGQAKYDVTLENLHDWTLRSVRIEPKLPYGVQPAERDREVDALLAKEKRTFAFGLIPQEEIDRKVRHEERLRAPVLAAEEPPRLTGRRFPREHTEAEVLEVVSWLDELLTMAAPGAAETMLEDIVEFGPHEYPVEALRVGEPVELGALEERFIPVDFEAEFKPPPPARPVLAPLEHALPYEEGFITIDQDEFASIKPLGLEPTIAEEIEIEPMEMDL